MCTQNTSSTKDTPTRILSCKAGPSEVEATGHTGDKPKIRYQSHKCHVLRTADVIRFGYKGSRHGHHPPYGQKVICAVGLSGDN
jgi:hypothetical protein